MSNFSVDMARALANINEDLEKVVKGTFFGLASRIIKRTPVGNPDLWINPAPPGYVGGTLRGAWQASVNQPNIAQKNSRDKSGQSTTLEVLQDISSWQPGESLYLTNAQPYAYRVEYGWSTKQRPQGMVRVSMKEIDDIVSKA